MRGFIQVRLGRAGSRAARCGACLLLSALLAGRTAAAGAEVPAPGNGERLERYIEAFVEFSRAEPAGGIRTAADYARQADGLRRWLKDLEAIPRAGLSLDQDIDFRLVRSSILTDIARIERERKWEKDPGMYIPYTGIESLVGARDLLPGEKRRRLLRALAEVPSWSAAARSNLKRPSRFLLDLAAGQLEKAVVYYKKEVRACLAALGAKDMEAGRTLAKAIAALKDYQEYLERVLRPQADPDPGIGRDLYDYYLRESHLMSDDADTLLEKGEAFYAATLRQLEETAACIDAKKSWQELIRENRRRHPAPGDLLAAWEREIQRARRHVIDRKLAAVPADESVVVAEMPPSQRGQSPFGVMDTPSPFSPDRVGRLLINPVEPGLPEATREKLLQGHDYTFISTIAPHETYPGHHLHALRIQENPRLMRRFYNSTLFTEGWGLYAEELMHETGFFQDGGRTRLTQLLSRLWRAARVILDVRLHTRRISCAEARRFLEENILFERERSEGEVTMYIAAPTYFITYINGYFDIMNLREEIREKQGGAFSLPEFHEAMLRTGALPTSLLRQALLARE